MSQVHISEATAKTLRDAATSHPDWRSYMAANAGLNSGNIKKEQCLAFLRERNVFFINDIGEDMSTTGTATGTTTATTAAKAEVMTTKSTGGAMAALELFIQEIAGTAVNRDEVARIVQEEINRALEGRPSFTITLAKADGVKTQLEGLHHPMFPTFLRVLSSRDASGRVPNVWLTGGTATGKTTMAEKAAEALELPFYMHGAMEMTHELVGFVDAGGTYHETQFVKAFRNGGVVLLDEIDSWGNGCTLALNAALANGQTSLPDGNMLKRHKDCIVVAAGNTWGTGATSDFIGRNKLDAAFLSRFPVKLHIEYDAALEQAFSGNRQWAERVQAARARAKTVGLKVVIDPRHSIAGAALIANGFSADEAAKLTYLAGLTPEQVKQVEGRTL